MAGESVEVVHLHRQGPVADVVVRYVAELEALVVDWVECSFLNLRMGRKTKQYRFCCKDFRVLQSCGSQTISIPVAQNRYCTREL